MPFFGNVVNLNEQVLFQGWTGLLPGAVQFSQVGAHRELLFDIRMAAGGGENEDSFESVYTEMDDLHRMVYSLRLRDLSGRGSARAEDAHGTPTQSHISPSTL